MDLFSRLGCLGLFLLVIPAWALRESLRSRKRSDEIAERIVEVDRRLDLLERRLLELKREGRTPAEASSVETVPEPSRPPAPPPAAQPAAPVAASFSPTPPPPAPLVPPHPPSPSPPPPPPPPPTPQFSVSPPEPSKPFDWENLISVRAFAWLGGAALFLGAVLFLQYGIQHGLISPAMRVAIGLVAGAAALVWGDSLRARSMWAGQATSGAGVGVLYASLYAAHALYGLLGTTATFAAMALVTLVAGLLAVRRDALILAILGLVGGFLTPFLLSTKEDHPFGLLGYVLLLDIGVLAVARKRRWMHLPLLALLGSALLYSGWASMHLTAVKLPWALGAAAVVAALFVLGTIREAQAGRVIDWPSATPVLAVLAPFLAVLTTAGRPTLAVSPVVLTGFLLLLGVQTFLVARRLEAAGVVPLAAATSLFCLALRIAPDLFPAHRSSTLALFTLVSLAYFVMWLVSRDSVEALTYRIGAAVALFGSLAITLRLLSVEPETQPILGLGIYAAIHAAGLLAMGALLLSGAWILAAQGYLFATLLALTMRFEVGRLPEFLPFLAIPAVVFWILPFTHSRFRADRAAWISAGLAPILQFAALYVLARTVWSSERLGFLSVLVGALALLAMRRALTMHAEGSAERRFTAALFGGVALLFLTAAIPILLDKQWITVAWALEAAALAWLSTRIREDGLVKAAGSLAAAAFVRLVANPALWSYQPRSETPIFNWYLYTFGIPAVAFLAAAHWLRDDPAANRVRLPGVLRTFAGIVLFVLLNVEIADFYSTGPTLSFRLSGGGLAQDMTYSLAWGIFALVLLFIGIARLSKPVRAAALAVLLLTIAKVFLHDLWNLGALYRVGSIVGLAVALLAVSFLTQRYVFAREKS